MNQNSNKSSGWTLCPSKSFPGKFYYFNGLTGETAWSVSDTDMKSLDKHPNRYANHPEPSYHPFIPETQKTPYNNVEKPKFGLKNSNKSPPIISSTQEFLTNHSTINYIQEMDSSISEYGPNPYGFSNPNTTNDYPDFATHSTPNFPIKSHPNDFATHSTPDFPIKSHPNDFSIHSTPDFPIRSQSNDFATPSTLDFHPSHPNNSSTSIKLSDFSLNSNINFATPSNSNDLSSNPTDFTIPWNSSSVTPAIRLPLLKLVIPTSTKTTDNVPKFIWAPIPIEYVNDQINSKTQVNKINGPTLVTTPLQRSIKNLSTTFIETRPQLNGKNNKNSNGPISVSIEQPLTRTIKNHPLINLNETDITSQSIIYFNKEEIRPKIDNLELIKKFRDKFNSNDINNSNSEIQTNLNPISEPKIIRKINKIPEYESKITKTLEFESRIIKTPKYESRIAKTPQFEAEITNTPQFESEITTTLEFESEVTKTPEFEESKISSKEVSPKKTLCQERERDRDRVENRKDYLHNLSENDLRTVLLKRRLEQNKKNEVPEKKARIDREVTPKKKVTFQLDFSDEETNQEFINDEEPERPTSLILSQLRQLGDIENTKWYIVVDLNVVQESFDFLLTFVQDDPLCNLLIPYSVYKWLSALCVGESRGARLVQFARQALRRIDCAVKSERVQVEKLTDFNEETLPQNAQILNCCFKLIYNNIHVVLITDSNILYKEALDNGIHVYKIEEIQYFDNEPELSFDIQKFKPVPNDNSIENIVTEDPNLNDDKEIISSVPNLNLNNDRTNVLNSNTERIRKNLFGPENSIVNNKVPNKLDWPDLSDISECTMISTEIQKTKNTGTKKHNQDTEQKVLSTFFSEEKRQFKIPNFKNLIIQSKITDKDTQLKVIGENVTKPKNTRLNNTQTKDTEVKSTHFEDVVVKDTISKVFNRNTMLRQLLLKDTEPINTQLKVTNENNTTKKDNRETNTEMKDTTEKGSIFEIESNFKPTSKTIEDELKSFYIKDKIVQKSFERRIDEYYCIFRQIFEGLHDIIKDISNSKCDGKKIWSLYDVLQVLRKNGNKQIQLISEKMIDLLHEHDYQGTAKLKIKLNPSEVIQVIGCGILLVKHLKECQETPELLELETNLNSLLNSVQNPEETFFDVTPPDVPKIYRTNKQRDRKNFIKPRKEIIDYLKKHFPQWKGHEDREEDKSLNNTHKSSKVKIVRTSGKNISLIRLNRTKTNKDNATENTEPNMINTLETEKDEEIQKNNPKDEKIQIQNDKICDLKNHNVVSSTEPIVIRSLNGFAQENDVIDYNLNESKHQNTFGAITNGPKVICKIAPIKEFEERIQNDLDKLDYSKISNTESELSIKTDGIIEENIDEISLTNDMENVVKRDDTMVHIEDKCLNGEKNEITKTITLKTSLNGENTRTNSLNDENKTINLKISLNEENTRTNSLNYENKTINVLNNENKIINSLHNENNRINSLIDANKIIDLSNEDSNITISLSDDSARINCLNNNNTRTTSLNERINSLNEIINSLNNGCTSPNSLKERFKSLNESINLLNEDCRKTNSFNEKNNSLNDNSTKANSLNERINSLTDESKIDSSKCVFENTDTNIKELNSPIIKRTGSLNENRKRHDSLTSSTHNDERCSSISTKSTMLLIENGKRTGSFDRTQSLSPCVSLLSDTEDDIFIIEDDYEPKKSVRFIKSFFKEIFKNFNRIICFCEKSLRYFERYDLNIKELKLIHNKALEIQNVLNKLITTLLRISVREENEGTFKSLFPKDRIHISYVKIIKKSLNQVNLLELTLEEIIMETS